MLLSLLLSSTLLFSLPAAAQVRTGKFHWLQRCNPARQKLQEGTFQFRTDCDAMTYCAANSTCARRGCRRDDYPFGYSANVTFPPKCGKGFFCPDEQDQCQKVLPVGSACQFNRDDECEGPPNFKELADTTGFGLNSNGSVCLHNRCMWANVTVGLPCIVENTAYTAYGRRGEFIHIVSRGNCKVGLYCDSQKFVCMQTKAIGAVCGADKECSTFNCASGGKCGQTTDTLRKVDSWVYAVVCVCIVGGMIGTPVALFFVDRKHRKVEREKRLQYWREQDVFRQNIMQMQDTTGDSLTSYTPPGSSSSPRGSPMFGHDEVQSQDSRAPMLHHVHGAPRGSGLRFYVYDEALQIDDDDNDDGYFYEGPTRPWTRPNAGRF